MVGKRGAPSGNTNRLKHGRYTAAQIASRKRVWEAIRSARLAVAGTKFFLLAGEVEAAADRQK